MQGGTVIKLLEMNTHEFAKQEPRLCFWPVGTVEAHDLGLLGTDVIAPEFNAVFLPTLPYGLVSSLSGYPGGMWVSANTYNNLIFELLASLAISEVEAVILFNGHGAEELALVYVTNPEIVPQTWGGSRAFRYREGLKAYPSPRSAIRYSEEQAKPFTPEKAAAYYEELKKRISEVIKDILSGWEAFNQPGKKEA